MSEQNYRAFWDEALKQIHDEYKLKGLESEFKLWFNMEYVEDTIETITVSVPSDFMWISMVNKGYVNAVESKIAELSGQNINLTYILKKRNSQKESESINSVPKTATIDSENSNISNENEIDSEKKSAPINSVPTFKIHPQLSEDYTFEKFVKGENSEFAYSASLAAAKEPGRRFNPLLIYGGVGLGKTHLMQSIGNYIYNNPPEGKENIKICYISAENFLNEFTFSLRDGTSEKFKNKYRKLDVLLLDDIHFLEDKIQTQEELFYTFEELYRTHAQIVFTCDRPISELNGIEDRLKSRFSMGTTIDLQPPSYEIRKAILLKKLEIKKKSVPEDVIDFIAKNIQSNVRELGACLDKMIGYAELLQKNLTIDIAKKLLSDNISKVSDGSISIDTIQKVVANHYNISLSDIKGVKRNKKIAYSRHIAIYISRILTESSFNEIAAEFGGKDHSTIMHSYNTIELQLKTDESLNSTIELLIKEIKDYKRL
ncbi:chromosomal replication initiator protein DnaA [uncultured Treponema sp.]|uniref:chromosomal replication initiator protein DnaA n=1 Tax=uncultured Treponema sp. TaxID=162155 RepID=UPI00280A841E|nr:chromosomal replication initiator protein DnaA [uncultured Treponema sp.]